MAPPAPFSEPLLPQLDLPTNPYYTEKHHRLRAFVRNYVDTELAPYAQEWEIAGQVPEHVRLRHCQLGFAITHPVVDPADAGGIQQPAGIPCDEWDTWCSVIVGDEFARLGWCGPIWGLGGGNGIGCPPIARYGTKQQRQRWLPKVATGEIRFCLGITEPDGGSDVANIRTTAERRGANYIVNGSKKWITNGIWCDYCTAAVRTGGPGRGGISLLVVPLKAKGVTTRRLENQGVHASGSTFITFEDVEVPVENLIGRENHGFQLIMSNFNPERLSLATAALRLARVCAQDAYTYACDRETFGKKLIEHAPIKSKIATFGLLIEPAHAFLEQLCYIIETGRVTGREVNVGGMTALLKVMSTRCLEKVCREAQQIMGGAGYAKTGRGARIEQISRDVRVHVVGGGSEEIMMDLAVRQEARDVELRAARLAASSKL
ncbi:acyl-CoA dehydrogenase [Cladophialophora psammophila CBS 110553]|uniref:Acyl-CoA dehydrogenase n=1 Tax=Cladophialophora psammophila CBS 110553 TaxID=1182543 RepID=W9X4A1_9EURO|nr:acyl-CoA dehydrogenase [Cladophialophora psammophila CBS 110553]EXJ75312.1 acyl-CoA dehydrogenase [Cladophialophora psammophila CBS 110553]